MVNAKLWLRQHAQMPADYAFRPIRRQARPDGVVRRKLAWNQWDAVYSRIAKGAVPMTDEQLAEMHKLLAEYHRGLAREAALDVVQQYHSDLAQRLADEAALIPRRTAIVQRLHERERQQKDEGE
jgi:hypothetical protein